MDNTGTQDESSLSKYAAHTAKENNTDINLNAIQWPFPNINEDLKFELDLGLALPFRYHAELNEDQKKTYSASVTRNIDAQTGNLNLIQITTQSDDGPLQAVEQDVLAVLLTLGYSQAQFANNPLHNQFASSDEFGTTNGSRIYYTLSEICRRLKLDVGSVSRVKKAIEKIKSQNITFKRSTYNAVTSKMSSSLGNTKIIIGDGRVRMTNKKDSDNFKELFYVDLDKDIMSKLYQQYFSSIDQDQYLSLGAGTPRRLFIFLQSKRKTQGDEFLFSLDELVQLFGFDNRVRVKRAVLEVLDKVKNSVDIFDYTIQLKTTEGRIKSKSDCSNFNVLIKFKSNLAIEQRKYEAFYQNLVDWYGEENLHKEDIQEFDVMNLKKELCSKYAKAKNDQETYYYSFGKSEINVGEFIIDIVLFQIFHRSYKVESFKALSKKLLSLLLEDQLELPEKYRLFLTDRLKDKKKKEDEIKIKELEERSKKKKEEEDRLFDESYKTIFNDFILNSEATKKQIELIAIKDLETEGYTAESLMFKSMVHLKMYEIGKKLFISGDLIGFSGNKKNIGAGNSAKLIQ
jgi:hypothetical protein